MHTENPELGGSVVHLSLPLDRDWETSGRQVPFELIHSSRMLGRPCSLGSGAGEK